MTQEIITYLILLATMGIVVFRIYRFLISFSKKKINQVSGKCSSCAGGCSLKDLKAAPKCPSSAPIKKEVIL